MCDLPASLVEDKTLRKLIAHVHEMGTHNETPMCPNKHELGAKKAELTMDITEWKQYEFCNFGRILNRVMLKYDLEFKSQLSGMSCTSGTICIDGAKNCKRNAINCVLQSCSKSVFLQHIDATGIKKDRKYLYTILVDLIHEVDLENVFIVCMDGASACKAANNLITCNYPTIFAQRCSTHAINFLMSDIAFHFKI
jgi:Protein of unknown function (DUF 659)